MLPAARNVDIVFTDTSLFRAVQRWVTATRDMLFATHGNNLMVRHLYLKQPTTSTYSVYITSNRRSAFTISPHKIHHMYHHSSSLKYQSPPYPQTENGIQSTPDVASDAHDAPTSYKSYFTTYQLLQMMSEPPIFSISTVSNRLERNSVEFMRMSSSDDTYRWSPGSSGQHKSCHASNSLEGTSNEGRSQAIRTPTNRQQSKKLVEFLKKTETPKSTGLRISSEELASPELLQPDVNTATTMSDVLSSKMEKRHRHISQVKPRRHRTRLFLVKRTRRTRAQQSTYQYPTSLFSSKPHFGSLSISKTSPEQFLTPLKAPSKLRPIPTLAHGLDRVLFSPGVHWVQDPRSRVYNFIPWVQNIPPLDDFAFNRVAEFVPSADDDSLQKLAKQHGKKFTGSTSSLSGMLCHIYFLLADRRKLNISMLSQSFSNESQSFTFGQMLPASVLLRYRDGVYSTNGDPTQPGEPEMNVLSRFGTMLEKFLTMPQLDFRHLTNHYVPLSSEDDALPEHCRYAKTDKYIMRSQLDCRDGRLPGSGVFDIKTRAALPIRLDLWNIKENSGYLIRHLHGRFQSFESEYYDLIRSAFLKYWFQARIGGMDGVFVTYHNTSMIFGFQYVPVSDMEYALFGDKKKGNFIFQACVKLLEDCMEKIVGLFPQTNISCHWDWNKRLEWVDIWAQPADKSKPVAQIRLIIPEIGLIDLLGQLERPEILNGSKPWKIPYLIDIATEPQEEILSELQRSIDRVAVYWTRGGGSASTSPRKPGNDSGSSFIRHLRKLSKQGKVHTERLAKAEAGKPRVVLGQ